MSESKQAVADVVGTDAAEFIRQLGNGEVAHDISTEMERVVKAVVETGKTGSVTVTVEIGPLKDTVEQLLVVGKVSAKIPKDCAKSVFFPTADGRLSRKNPNQVDFDDKLGV